MSVNQPSIRIQLHGEATCTGRDETSGNRPSPSVLGRVQRLLKSIPVIPLVAAVVLSGTALGLPGLLRSVSMDSGIATWLRAQLPHTPATAVNGVAGHLANLAMSVALNIEKSPIREVPAAREPAGIPMMASAQPVTGDTPLLVSCVETGAGNAAVTGTIPSEPASGVLAMDRMSKHPIITHLKQSGGLIRLRVMPESDGKSPAPRTCVVTHRVIG